MQLLKPRFENRNPGLYFNHEGQILVERFQLMSVLLVLILVSLWVLFYQFLKQQGRLLLRLDDLERLLASQFVASGGFAPQNGSSGLALGARLESFRLPNLTGQIVELEEFRGRQILLINWSIQCGYCDQIAPSLASLEADLKKFKIELVLVTNSNAESMRAPLERHGLKCPVLVLTDGSSLPAFQGVGTPAAYHLDEQGAVLHQLAVGTDQVLHLARAAASGSPRKRLPGERPLSESQIERSGLKPGSVAPAFSLPDTHGRTISLQEYRGRRVLLVFSDPQCGPCDQLAPQLARLSREHAENGLSLLMVGRGALEENRRKAEHYGFEFPVVLQRKWELSKKYGIFATPAAFLINREGIIAQKAATGVDEILALAAKG